MSDERYVAQPERKGRFHEVGDGSACDEFGLARRRLLRRRPLPREQPVTWACVTAAGREGCGTVREIRLADPLHIGEQRVQGGPLLAAVRSIEGDPIDEARRLVVHAIDPTVSFLAGSRQAHGT